MLGLGFGLADIAVRRGGGGGAPAPHWYDAAAHSDYGFAEGKAYIGGAESDIASKLMAARAGTTSTASRRDGTIVSFGANAPRITNRGLHIEEAWSGGCNINLDGAAAGSPGTLPSGVSIEAPGGISWDVAAVGSELGLNTFDLHLSGTPAADGTIRIYFTDANKIAAGATNARGISGCRCKMVGGGLANIASVGVRHANINSGLTEVGASAGIQYFIPDATTQDVYAPGGGGGTTSSWLRGELQLAVINGQAINITLRLSGLITVGHGTIYQYMGQPIRSGTAVASRAADDVRGQAPPQIPLSCVVEFWGFVDGSFGPAGAATAIYIGDGTLNNRVVVNTTTGGVTQVRYLVGNVVVASIDLITMGGQRPATVAFSLTNTELKASVNGGPVSTASHAASPPTFTTTMFGGNPGSIFGSPVIRRATLYSYAMDDTQLRAAARRDLMMFALCAGDSLTYGWMGAEFETNYSAGRNPRAYPGQLAKLVGGGYRQPGFAGTAGHVHNAGVYGETSTQIKTRITALDWSYQAKFLLIWAGQNNVSAPATVASDVADMVSFANTRGMDYRVMAPIFRVATTAPDKANIDTIRSTLSGTYGAKYIDNLGPIQPFADPVLDASSIAIGALPNTMQIADGHPNSRYYELLVSECIAPSLGI